MAAVVMAAVGALALLVFLFLGIVIELHRDVRQLRDAVGILDRPLTVELGAVAGGRPSSYGLPRALDSAESAIVLFLSDRCATCHTLAGGLGGSLPAGLWVVVEARGPAEAEEFLAKYDLTARLAGGRVLVDVARAIAERMGLRTTPVGFRVERGRFVSATTVPSRRYLSSILSERLSLERATAPLAVVGR